MEQIRPILAKKFGTEPSDNDVAWACLNRQSLNAMRNGQLGLYRNSRLGMAAVLDGEKKCARALRFYFAVCYLDLIQFNGLPEPLAPAVLSRIIDLIMQLELDEFQVQDEFRKNPEKERKELLFEDAWTCISDELYGPAVAVADASP